MRDLKGLKIDLQRYFKKITGQNTQAVFIETSFASESMGGAHALIDAIAVPELNIEHDEEDFDPLGGQPGDIFSDLDLFFRKTLTDSSSEWEKSHHKNIIDTKVHRGNISKAVPNKG